MVWSKRSTGASRKRCMNEIPALLTQADKPSRADTSAATSAAASADVTSSAAAS